MNNVGYLKASKNNDEALNITACKTIDNSNNRIVCKSVYIKK